MFTHQTSDTIYTDYEPFLLQNLVHLWAAIDPIIFAEYPLYIDHKLSISLGALRLSAIFPGVIAFSTDIIDTAQKRKRVVIPLSIYELEDLFFRSEQNWMLFFKRSCSIFKVI